MSSNPSIKKSIIIVGLEKFALIFFQFISTIIMARLLCPEDYGTVAMLSIFLSLAGTLVDSGFGGSLIYFKDVTKKDFSTVFWINIIMSICLYLILVLSSNAIALFYKTPILASIIKVLGLTIVFNSLGQVQYSMLYKNLQFKKLSIINVVTYICSVICAIFLAYKGFGVWALVTQQVLSSVLRTIILISCNRFLPDLYFSIKLLMKHWNYGSGLFFSNILRIVYDNMYVQLIGKYTSITNSGYYNQAKRLKDIPTDLFSKTFTTTLFPILSKISNDFEFVRRFRNTSRLFAFVCCPLFFVLSILSHNIVSLLLGEKWMESAWIFQIICIGAIFYILENMNRNALKSKGQSMLIFRQDLIKRAISLIIMLFAVYKYQVIGICVAYVINSIIGWVINAFSLSRYSSYTFISQVFDIFRYFSLSGVIAMLVFFIQKQLFIESDVYSILVFSVIYFMFYIVIAIIIQDSSLKYFEDLVRVKFHK